MEEIELGLPLEYQQMPEYFDAHNVLDDTQDKNALLLQLLKQHKICTVLDMTCGTGSQVFYLNKQGYNVTGSDFSPALLDIARKKAASSNLDIKFIDGDMRSLNIGKFDAIITMFNAIGHVSKPDFETTLNNINGNLNRGGIYVFDIFNLAAMSDLMVENLAMETTKTAQGDKIHNVQHSEINREKGLLTSFDQYTIQKANAEVQKLNHSFTLQIYTAQQLQDMLSQNGFEIVHQCAMDGTEFVEQATESILTIARKL